MNKNIIIVGAMAAGLYLLSQTNKPKKAVAKKKPIYHKPKIKRVIARKKPIYHKPKPRIAILRKQKIKRMARRKR